mmetsp:Transcript_37059/g.68640  ORF Transcript_37059/g.68640 Transcript_37059/m.68640 type:complete len:471 (-) Transcript_37059:166-1578(-)|eukprot:CAMPEP_0196130528 /NCGR_PEP_ID=MMETSP0910-20130528/871_1 /TAXON_ID=49265 /ORGANISM="Thalassiosira rotula, Strain GSO102" /LENGTH=470 /DNA_ID=CAMNT_0041389857 /DNA_START=70 /DNA_END=1482 /DNA_ORIENTATION=-
MKFASVLLVNAALAASVSGFVSPSSSSVVTRNAGIAPKNGFYSAPNRQAISPLNAAREENLDVFIRDMLKISSFVYAFRNIRNIVKTNDGKPKKKKTGLFRREEYTVKFDTPALVLTQKGAQEEDDNKFFKYTVTPDAIKLFIEKNRKWFKEPEGGGDWTFDKSVSEKTTPFIFESEVKGVMQDNLKIVDYDDEFSTDEGGLVYAVVVNLTRKWISVVFRGTVGSSDIATDRNFNFDYDSFFKGEDILVPGGKPATHEGFTKYLMDPKMGDQDGRRCLDRILACVNDEFGNNVDVVGKDFNLYVSGHSLGGGLANLFSFRAAQLKAKGDESVKNLPEKITALTFAAPVVGNVDFNKEYQVLEKKGVLRHIRVANKGDVVPTNNIIFPASLALKGDTTKYIQNGVSLFLLPEEELEQEYGGTKSCASQFTTKALTNHLVPEYATRVTLPVNKEKYQQTVEEIYVKEGVLRP